jgi:hypothetical protein
MPEIDTHFNSWRRNQRRRRYSYPTNVCALPELLRPDYKIIVYIGVKSRSLRILSFACVRNSSVLVSEEVIATHLQPGPRILRRPPTQTFRKEWTAVQIADTIRKLIKPLWESGWRGPLDGLAVHLRCGTNEPELWCLQHRLADSGGFASVAFAAPIADCRE